MKSKKTILFSAVLLLIFSIASCKKDEDSSSGGGSYSEFVFSADINGNHWEANRDTMSFFVVSPDCGLTYGSGSSNGTDIYIHLEGQISAGTSFILNENNNSFIEIHKDFDFYSTTSGLATITYFNQNTRSISITFSATLVSGGGDYLQVTNGLIKNRPFFGPYNSNSMSANINGNPIAGMCTPTGINLINENSILAFSNNPQADVFFALFIPNNCVSGDSYQVGNLVVGSTVLEWTTGSCSGGNCNYTFILTDSYGDGWNGAEMEIRQGSNVVTTLGPNFQTGYSSNNNITLQSNQSYSLVFTNGGDYPSEVGVVIVDPNGYTIFNSDLDSGAKFMFSIGPYSDYYGHGSINVTNHNTSLNKISGTFAFQGIDDNGIPFSIEDGTFDVTYQDMILMKNPTGEKTLHKFIGAGKNKLQKNEKHHGKPVTRLAE